MEMWVKLYRNAGVQPHIVQQKPTLPLLATCKGISIGAEGSRSEFSRNIVAVLLDEPNGRINVFMAWRKREKSTSVLGFLNTVREVFKTGEDTLLPGASSKPKVYALATACFINIFSA
jgi:hypothetical protein